MISGLRLALIGAVGTAFAIGSGFLITHPTAEPVTAYRTPTPVEAMRLQKLQTRVHDEAKPQLAGQSFFKDATFVGAETCGTCHTDKFKDWQRTWHSKMEQWPTDDIVVGDFNTTVTYKDVREVKTTDGKPAPLNADGKPSTVTYQVKTFRKDGGYWFTVLDADNAANNQTYKIGKVLGGKWDQHYEAEVKGRYIPTPLRWSVISKEWIINDYRPYDWIIWDGTPDGRPRRPEELPANRFAEARCAGCHTTGYVYKKNPADNHWEATGDGRLGIGCEQCHGPGSKHVAEAKVAASSGTPLASGTSTIVHPLKDLNAYQQNQICAACHGRSNNKQHPDLATQQGFRPGDTNMNSLVQYFSYSSTPFPSQTKYFWSNDWAKRNRQQWQDFTKSTHFNKAGLTCITCHTFHGEWTGPQLRSKVEDMCVSCHSEGGRANRHNKEFFAGSPMQKAGVECVDCHMPKSAYRTGSTTKFARQWHGSLHTFIVATPAIEKEHGVRSSCSACHSEDDPERRVRLSKEVPTKLIDELDHDLRGRQAKIRAGIEEVNAMLAEAKRRGPASELFVNAARTQIGIITNDGSLGFHNYDKAQRILDTARVLAKRGLGVPTAAGWQRQQAVSPPKPSVPVTTVPAAPVPLATGPAEPKPGHVPASGPAKASQGADVSAPPLTPIANPSKQ